MALNLYLGETHKITEDDLLIDKGSLVIFFPARVLEAVLTLLKEGVTLECGEFTIETIPQDKFVVSTFVVLSGTKEMNSKAVEHLKKSVSEDEEQDFEFEFHDAQSMSAAMTSATEGDSDDDDDGVTKLSAKDKSKPQGKVEKDGGRPTTSVTKGNSDDNNDDDDTKLKVTELQQQQQQQSSELDQKVARFVNQINGTISPPTKGEKKDGKVVADSPCKEGTGVDSQVRVSRGAKRRAEKALNGIVFLHQSFHTLFSFQFRRYTLTPSTHNSQTLFARRSPLPPLLPPRPPTGPTRVATFPRTRLGPQRCSAVT